MHVRGSKSIMYTVKKMRYTIIRLAISIFLLVLIYGLSGSILFFMKLFLEEKIAKAIYLSLLGTTILSTSYYIYKTHASITARIIEMLSTKPTLRPAIPIVSLFSKIMGLVLASIVTLSLFSIEIPLFFGLMQGILASFSGIFSILIALILALQVKEIAGNYIAGLVMKASALVSEQEFLNIDQEDLKVEKIDYSHTKLLNHLGEEIYLPNLKFLTDAFRKPSTRKIESYINLRFSLPYLFSQEEVQGKIAEIVERHNSETQGPASRIKEYRLLLLDLAGNAIVYELQIKVYKRMFPEVLRSSIRQLLHKEFGEDLATPILLDMRK